MSVPVSAERSRGRAHLGRCLRLARDAARLSQAAAAAALEVSRNTIGNWEDGDSEPLALDLLRLADLYRVSLAALVGREPIPAPPAE